MSASRQHWRARRARRRGLTSPHGEGWQGELAQALAGRPHAPAGGPRVVFLPGLLGSTLVDTSLTPQQARELCTKNLGGVARVVRGGPLDPCDKGPEQLWDAVGSLHWLFSPREWEARMRRGDGYAVPGAVRPGGLFEAEVRLRRRTFAFKPYASFLRALRAAGADVLAVPYDWRLGCLHNAGVVQRAILARWFGGRAPERGRPLRQSERIIVIGHSLGGLVARYFLESAPLGRDLARDLVTIGTPHLGAPQAWLYFTGREFPFPENPFYRWASDVLGAQLSAAGMSVQGAVAAQVLPGPTQTAVMQHSASAIELLPVYDFVVDRGRPEPFAHTYQGAVHTGTGRPAMDVIKAYRDKVLTPPALEAWLARHGLHYHCLGAAGIATATGFDRTRNRKLASSNGDGTVPLPSAHIVAKGTPHIHTVLLTQDRRNHPRLCERRDVQAYCVKLIRSQGKLPPRATKPTVAGRPAGTQESKYTIAARAILAEARWSRSRGVVMCRARLWSNDGRPLLDPTAQGGRLVRPLQHMSDEVKEITTRHGTFRWVWIKPNVSVPRSGGVAFLPAAGASDFTLVTFNIEKLDADFRRSCGNQHHAEQQLVGFIDAQRPAWRRRLGLLQLYNESRYGPNRGYSACSACCDDLAKFLFRLNDERGRSRKARASISWHVLYDKRADCGHPTTMEAIDMMIDRGWDPPQGPRPLRPASAPGPAPGPIRRRPGVPAGAP